MARRGKLVLQIAAVCVVGLLLALLGWRLASRQAGQNVARGVERGEAPAAPDFALEQLDGSGEVRLAELEGKAVVINFWASWCVPCREEAPRLQAAWEEWQDEGVVVLGINAQDFVGDARKFVDRYGLTYPNVHDGPGSTLGRFGVTGFPETWFVDREGRLVGARIQGPVSEQELEENIRLAAGSGEQAAGAVTEGGS
jgi:cytochrome c biogenesis protein CcmG/thiol:disulfide interchange protein DsbE